MRNFFEVLIDALSLGSLYALVALGISIVFGVMNLINFAYGQIIMISAFVLLSLGGVPFLLAALVVIVTGGVVAYAMERVAFRPVRSAPPTTMLITSFALSYILENGALLIQGGNPDAVTTPSVLGHQIQVFGLQVSVLNLCILIGTIVLTVGLVGLLRYTKVGLHIRAASEDFVMARLLGVRANRVIGATFAISGLIGGLVTIAYTAQTGSVSPTTGSDLALIGFVATVVGGLGSIAAAGLGGLFLGLATIFLQAYLPLPARPFRDAFVFTLVFAVLLLRPQGLLRRARAFADLP